MVGRLVLPAALVLPLLLPGLLSGSRTVVEAEWTAPPGQYGLPALKVQGVAEWGGWLTNAMISRRYLRVTCGDALRRSVSVPYSPDPQDWGWARQVFTVAWTEEGIEMTPPAYTARWTSRVSKGTVISRQALAPLRLCL